ncbi:sulfur carrier protein ThiS [Paenibacillus sp. EC2-1]|uniref:sulfur carrier protein ThiS n=1 Tax=Paenibacillus sp. EC2-1 TaxID=3388665 RepID=UPI003BEEFC1C
MIQVNGKTAVLTEDIHTVSDLLVHYQLNPKLVIVEQNGQIVEKEAYGITIVQDGDKIELVHFVGGG